MELFTDFNHFIAYFIPGVILCIALVFGASLFLGINLLAHLNGNDFSSTSALFLVVLVGGTVMGLFLDGFRHNFIEDKLESQWVRAKGINQAKYDELIPDFAAFIGVIGKDAYETILNENFYFYEFEFNTAMVIPLLVIVSPFYLSFFYAVDFGKVALMAVILLCTVPLFFHFSLASYHYFMDSMLSCIKKADPKIVKEIY